MAFAFLFKSNQELSTRGSVARASETFRHEPFIALDNS